MCIICIVVLLSAVDYMFLFFLPTCFVVQLLWLYRLLQQLLLLPPLLLLSLNATVNLQLNGFVGANCVCRHDLP